METTDWQELLPGATPNLQGAIVLSELGKRINTLAQWMFKSKHLVVFTGAGISTE